MVPPLLPGYQAGADPGALKLKPPVVGGTPVAMVPPAETGARGGKATWLPGWAAQNLVAPAEDSGLSQAGGGGQLVGAPVQPRVMTEGVETWARGPGVHTIWADATKPDELLATMYRGKNRLGHDVFAAEVVPAGGAGLTSPGCVGDSVFRAAPGEPYSPDRKRERVKPHVIFGGDSREPLRLRSPAWDYPYRCICGISPGGTGTLVGPRHVLTAAHVVHGVNKAELTVRFGESLRFDIGTASDFDWQAKKKQLLAAGIGEEQFHPIVHPPIGVQEVCVNSTWDYWVKPGEYADSVAEMAHDYAVLVLKTPPSMAELTKQMASVTGADSVWESKVAVGSYATSYGWLGTSVYNSDLDGCPVFTHLGLKWLPDESWGFMTVQENLRIDEIYNTEYPGGLVLKHKSDTMKGHSGGPFYTKHPVHKWLSVFAVHSSGDSEKHHNYAASGYAMLSLVWAARKKYP